MSQPGRAGIPSRRPDQARAALHQRDAGLARGRSITKGIGFGSVAAVAVAGVYLSQALPGHAASPTSTPTSSTSGSTTGTGTSAPAAADSSGTPATPTVSQGSGISPPASAPAPANQQAPVVSGSS